MGYVSACTEKAVRARYKSSFPSDIKLKILNKVVEYLKTDKVLRKKLRLKGRQWKLNIIISISAGRLEVLLGQGRKYQCLEVSILNEIKNIIHGKNLSGLYSISASINPKAKVKPTPTKAPISSKSSPTELFMIRRRPAFPAPGMSSSPKPTKQIPRKSLPRKAKLYLRKQCKRLYQRLKKGYEYKFKVLISNSGMTPDIKVAIDYKGTDENVDKRELRLTAKMLRNWLAKNLKFQRMLEQGYRYKYSISLSG